MRQIISPSPWSGSSNAGANSRDGRMRLNTADTASSRGETDSSFEVPSARSTNGSMKFVPADKFVETPETSWGALANDTDMYSKGNTSTASRTTGTQSRSFLRKSRQQHRSEAATSVSGVSSALDGGSRSGSKIGRIASMFSSRAVPVPSSSVGQQAAPSSPIRSESSTGYVGWPGTQDKEGVTVMAELSYDQSDASAGSHGYVDPSQNEHEQDKIHRLEMHQNPMQMIQTSGYADNEDAMSGYSKTSSAYFNAGEVQAIRKGNAQQILGGTQNKNRMAASTVMRRCLTQSMAKAEEQSAHALTEERLAMNNRFTAPNRNFTNGAAAGYRGLLDRTRDVPNLIDDTSSDSTSAISAAMSRQSRQNDYRQQRQIQRENNPVRTIDEEDDNQGTLGATSRPTMTKLNLALLGGGLTTIQTTAGDFTNRTTAEDFDETLTNSDCDQNGFVKIPAFHEMLSAGRNQHDKSFTAQSLVFAAGESHEPQFSPPKFKNDQFVSGNYNSMKFHPTQYAGDFSEFYIHPEEMQIVVKKFRKMSAARCQHLDYDEFEREEDATKAFALSEMRSRIMEKDIERGLGRRGGTTVVDDIVMTSYHKAALRVRDAVIVAKAWRDGATPQDIVNTANLTRRDERDYCIPRWDKSGSRYVWEEVNWFDDNELSQYRCHSLGPRHLKGSEMFTIGDCQSILLKLSNERCQELRAELNEATARQIEAEGLMKQEGETFDGMMTEAEMTYLASMEDVKSISHKLVLAEKSFGLVKDRIEKLVAKYEALLVHFENETESVAPSSVFSYESSCYSETYSSFTAAKQREDEELARRAQRAELRAELFARESLLAKQGMSSARRETEKEVNNLKARIADLQSEASVAHAERDRSAVLARAITRSNQNNNRSKINDIKQRFRNRSAAKSQFNSVDRPNDSQRNQNQSPNPRAAEPVNKNNSGNSFNRTVGEEMFQHLDFYERSLKAVERPR